MKVIQAAEKTKEYLEDRIASENLDSGNPSTCNEHLIWMLDGIILGYIQYEKAHRWLGYVQGVMCFNWSLPHAVFAEINKKSKGLD